MVSTQLIIDQKAVEVAFQLVVSHHRGFARGVEAFIHAYLPETGERISPQVLFQLAEEEGLVMALNELTVIRILEEFEKLYLVDPELLLYVNVHSSLIHNAKEILEVIDLEMAKCSFEKTSIILDIGDYSDVTAEEVFDFIGKSREQGFYISIDDIGKTYFNLDRILLFNPDIIKINQQYVGQLSHASYRNLMLKHVANLAHEMGIVVVVTGVETEEEVREAFIQGAQYFQGYYLAKPRTLKEISPEEMLDTEHIMAQIEPYRPEALVDEVRPVMNKMVMILNLIKEESKSWTMEELPVCFEKIFKTYPSVENGALLSKDGIQISEAWINNEGFVKRNAKIFKIYGQGHDYTNQEFFYILNSGMLDVWITKPYISLLTNRICFTSYSYIIPVDGDPHILMLVFNYEDFKQMLM